MGANDQEPATYSYIDNPDIKAELSKLDYLLNVHLKNEQPRSQGYQDTFNDRDPEELYYHERESEFDRDAAWQTFNRPDSDNDIKLKTVTELQEFNEDSEEEAGGYEGETGEYIEDVPEDIHREVEDEF